MKSDEQRIRILVVEDHPLVRQAIVTLLNLEKDFIVCGEADNTISALEVLNRETVDVVILDIGLGETDGLSTLKKIKEQHPMARVLVFSGQEEMVFGPRLARAGACGYVMKSEPHETLLAALRKAAAGEFYFSKDVERHLLQQLTTSEPIESKSPIDVLTDRELEVFTLFGHGHTSREVAEKLNLSVKTIEAHRSNIKEKLNLPSSNEFFHQAVQWVRGAPK